MAANSSPKRARSWASLESWATHVRIDSPPWASQSGRGSPSRKRGCWANSTHRHLGIRWQWNQMALPDTLRSPALHVEKKRSCEVLSMDPRICSVRDEGRHPHFTGRKRLCSLCFRNRSCMSRWWSLWAGSFGPTRGKWLSWSRRIT